MKLKGQILVFEQVLLFTISVAIFVTSFALFIMYQNYYVSETSGDQLGQVRDYILSHIIEISKNEDFESTATLSIPRRVGNGYYKIKLSDLGINVTFWPVDEGGERFSTLYGLNETISFGGEVVSDRGKIVIYKRGNSIYIQ